MTEIRSVLLATMFGSIPQGAGDLFATDDDLAEFCAGTLTKSEQKSALKDIAHLLSLSSQAQFEIWNSFNADIKLLTPDHAVKFTNLLYSKLGRVAS